MPLSIGTPSGVDRHIQALFGFVIGRTIGDDSDPAARSAGKGVQMYAIFGLAHARGEFALDAVRRRLACERGQGTVEYVGLVLLVAALMGGMVAAVGGLGSLSGIGKELGEAITKKIVEGVKKITFAG